MWLVPAKWLWLRRFFWYYFPGRRVRNAFKAIGAIQFGTALEPCWKTFLVGAQWHVNSNSAVLACASKMLWLRRFFWYYFPGRRVRNAFKAIGAIQFGTALEPRWKTFLVRSSALTFHFHSCVPLRRDLDGASDAWTSANYGARVFTASARPIIVTFTHMAILWACARHSSAVCGWWSIERRSSAVQMLAPMIQKQSESSTDLFGREVSELQTLNSGCLEFIAFLGLSIALSLWYCCEKVNTNV
jgi:hypothetical protein